MLNYHQPVLLSECLDWLQPQPGGVYVDATLGDGGHSQALLQHPANVLVYSFDQDDEALLRAGKRLHEFGSRFNPVKSNFRRIRTQLAMHRVMAVDGILFDLGVSSRQIDEPTRGFSYSQNGPLDMRMDASLPKSALELVNTAPQKQLAEVIFTFGEERRSREIAAAIVAARQKKPLETTAELANLLDSIARGPQAIKTKARVFQALRMVVNDELAALETALEQAGYLLKPGGRLVVISYHSLEDRAVKTYMNKEHKGCVCPPNIPACVCGHKSTLKILTKKPVQPTAAEVAANPRASAAKLRVAEKKGVA